MSKIHELQIPKSVIGGFSALLQYRSYKTLYYILETELPMHKFLELYPSTQVGLGDSFDGFLEYCGKYYFIYFRDYVNGYQALKDFSHYYYSFDFQCFFYDLDKNIFYDTDKIRKKTKPIESFYEDIPVNHFLEAVFFHVLTNQELQLPKKSQLTEQASPLLFRAIVESLFKQKKAYEGFYALNEHGLLDYYLPELNTLKGIEQDKDYHPEGDAFDHVLECLKYLNHGSMVLNWAVLLHDIGKAVAERSGPRKFDKHGEKGVKIAEKILSRMVYSDEFIDEVCFLIRHHMYPIFIPHMNFNEKAKLIRHPLVRELFQLFKIDILGSHQNLQFYHRMKNLLWTVE